MVTSGPLPGGYNAAASNGTSQELAEAEWQSSLVRQTHAARRASAKAKCLELVVVVGQGRGRGVGELLLQRDRVLGRDGELGRRERGRLHKPAGRKVSTGPSSAGLQKEARRHKLIRRGGGLYRSLSSPHSLRAIQRNGFSKL